MSHLSLDPLPLCQAAIAEALNAHSGLHGWRYALPHHWIHLEHHPVMKKLFRVVETRTPARSHIVNDLRCSEDREGGESETERKSRASSLSRSNSCTGTQNRR